MRWKRETESGKGEANWARGLLFGILQGNIPQGRTAPGIDGLSVEPEKCRAAASKKFRLGSLEIEASMGVKPADPDAGDALQGLIAEYKAKQSRVKDDQRCDAMGQEGLRRESFGYRSPPKPPRTSRRASNGRGWHEQKAFRR